MAHRHRLPHGAQDPDRGLLLSLSLVFRRQAQQGGRGLDGQAAAMVLLPTDRRDRRPLRNLVCAQPRTLP